MDDELERWCDIGICVVGLFTEVVSSSDSGKVLVSMTVAVVFMERRQGGQGAFGRCEITHAGSRCVALDSARGPRGIFEAMCWFDTV